MRIISGKYGSRIIKTPRGFVTHPMGERPRSALFNSLGDLSDLEVWDAFAGSGALAFEAVSRGAKSALATERDRKAYQVLKENAEKLNAHNIQVVKASCRAWSKNNRSRKFDIIFCDPPYNDLQLETVFSLISHLKPNGLMVLSYPGNGEVPTKLENVVVDVRSYGDAVLIFYRKEGA